MLIVNHAVLPVELHPGWQSQCVAGPALGCAGFEVRVIELEAWASADLSVHRGERVLLVQAGSGKQRLDGEPQAFHAPCTACAGAGPASALQLRRDAAAPDRNQRAQLRSSCALLRLTASCVPSCSSAASPPPSCRRKAVT